MSQPKRRISQAKQLGNRIILSDDQWHHIEKVYGSSLSSPVRFDIMMATDFFTLTAPAEKTAAPIKVILKKIQRLNEVAQDLRAEFSESHLEVNLNEIDLTLDGIIRKYFQQKLWKPPHYLDALFPLLEHVLNATIEVGNFVSKEISDPAYGGLSEGYMWQTWVQALTSIMVKHGLPYKIRKDWDKQSVRTPSRFVLFVYELQQHLPSSCRRHSGSDALSSSIALTQAIDRTRQDGLPTGDFDGQSLLNFLQKSFEEKKSQ